MLTNEEAANAVRGVRAAERVDAEIRAVLKSDRYVFERDACFVEIKSLREAALDAEINYNSLLLKTKHKFVQECERRFPNLIFDKCSNGIHVYQDEVKLCRLTYWIREESDGVSVLFYRGVRDDCDCLSWEALALTFP